jgi:hypothetical protein
MGLHISELIYFNLFFYGLEIGQERIHNQRYNILLKVVDHGAIH